MLHLDALKKLMENQGAVPLGSTPEEMTTYLQREIDKYAKLIKASGAQAD